jgi:hypothetical protein
MRCCHYIVNIALVTYGSDVMETIFDAGDVLRFGVGC